VQCYSRYILVVCAVREPLRNFLKACIVSTPTNFSNADIIVDFMVLLKVCILSTPTMISGLEKFAGVDKIHTFKEFLIGSLTAQTTQIYLD